MSIGLMSFMKLVFGAIVPTMIWIPFMFSPDRIESYFEAFGAIPSHGMRTAVALLVFSQHAIGLMTLIALWILAMRNRANINESPVLRSFVLVAAVLGMIVASYWLVGFGGYMVFGGGLKEMGAPIKSLTDFRLVIIPLIGPLLIGLDYIGVFGSGRESA